MSTPPVKPGSEYGPYLVLELADSSGVKGGRAYTVRCRSCERTLVRSIYALTASRLRGSKQCQLCITDRAKAKRAAAERRRARRRAELLTVWTGSEYITQIEAARRLGVSRQRVNQLVKQLSGDLSSRWRTDDDNGA